MFVICVICCYYLLLNCSLLSIMFLMCAIFVLCPVIGLTHALVINVAEFIENKRKNAHNRIPLSLRKKSGLDFSKNQLFNK